MQYLTRISGTLHSTLSDWIQLDARRSVRGSNRIPLFSPPRSDIIWGPPSIISSEYQGSYPGIKSVESENAWSFASISVYGFM
jgi:hypothetical protein